MEPMPDIQGRPEQFRQKLKDKVAVITGGDSGIGHAVAIAFAREGAKVAIVFLNEEVDALRSRQDVERAGSEAVLYKGDIGDPEFCKKTIDQVVKDLGSLDILVNNAAEQHPREDVREISPEQLLRTFQTNVFSMFYLTQAALPHLKAGSAIINTTSVTAYRGSSELLDYSSSKGAIVAFTRSLSKSLAEKNIRVNGVAPGPVWTPLITSTFPPDKVKDFGKDVPLGRAGQPEEIAPAFVFLASSDSSYMTGQILHPNGGEIVNA